MLQIGQATGTLYHDLNPRAQPAFQVLTQAPGNGTVVQIADAEFLA
jgi:hypothetical protein